MNPDTHVADWLKQHAPVMPDALRDQIIALWPVTAIADSEHEYINRQAAAGTYIRDSETGVRYIALAWPTGVHNERVLRLYVVPQQGTAFLCERSWTEAESILCVPGLPRPILRGIEDYIKRYRPKHTEP